MSLEEVARETNNYTGAELTAVVKCAVSYALERGLRGESTERNKNNECHCSDDSNSKFDPAQENTKPDEEVFKVTDDIKICMEAIDEVKPAFGLNEQEFTIFKKSFYTLNFFTEIMQRINEKITYLLKTAFYNTSNVLLTGENGVGKTTLCVRAALQAKIPYVKLISPREVIGYSDIEKVQFITEIFINGYKSKHCLIIIDDIESLIDYVPLGPRFSNSVLQTIKTFVRMESTSKTFVIATCTCLEIIEELSLRECFDDLIVVRKIKKEDLKKLEQQNSAFGRIKEDEIAIRELLSKLDICDTEME